jgi:hypothetical protein
VRRVEDDATKRTYTIKVERTLYNLAIILEPASAAAAGSDIAQLRAITDGLTLRMKTLNRK